MLIYRIVGIFRYHIFRVPYGHSHNQLLVSKTPLHFFLNNSVKTQSSAVTFSGVMESFIKKQCQMSSGMNSAYQKLVKSVYLYIKIILKIYKNNVRVAFFLRHTAEYIHSCGP